MFVEILDSDKPTKKHKAIFYNNEKKKIKTVYFGSASNKDFTIYSKENKELAQKKKEAYLKRHKVRENWNDYMSAGSLSRYILWNLPNKNKSISDYKKRFNLKTFKK
jgi:hypothetical protein